MHMLLCTLNAASGEGIVIIITDLGDDLLHLPDDLGILVSEVKHRVEPLKQRPHEVAPALIALLKRCLMLLDEHGHL